MINIFCLEILSKVVSKYSFLFLFFWKFYGSCYCYLELFCFQSVGDKPPLSIQPCCLTFSRAWLSIRGKVENSVLLFSALSATGFANVCWHFSRFVLGVQMQRKLGRRTRACERLCLYYFLSASYKWCLVGVLWHINPCELFNAKFCLFICDWYANS